MTAKPNFRLITLNFQLSTFNSTMLYERTLGQWLEHWAETTPDKEYIVFCIFFFVLYKKEVKMQRQKPYYKFDL